MKKQKKVFHLLSPVLISKKKERWLTIVKINSMNSMDNSGSKSIWDQIFGYYYNV